MPRTRLDLPYHIDYLSILGPDGTLDKELEPKIDEAELVRLYRGMLLARRFDERMLNLQRQGRIGTFAPIKGQEAAQLGSVYAITPADWMVPSFRETATMLWRGWPMELILLFFAGYLEGMRVPDGVRDLPITIPVASQLPHAVGLAYAARYKGDDAVVLTYFGDGATSEGDFHEAMNFAGVLGAPVIFLCQNNQWAISVPRKKQTQSRTLAQKALAYGFPGIQVDGNDILAVYAASREAVGRARDGGGPAMIECITYRLGVHTTADDPKRYRSEEEVKEWERKDPLTRFRDYLQKKDLLGAEQEHRLEEEVGQEIADAISRFESRQDGDPLAMFDHIYAERPSELEAERQELVERLGATGTHEAAGPEGGQAESPAPTPMRGQRRTSRWPN